MNSDAEGRVSKCRRSTARAFLTDPFPPDNCVPNGRYGGTFVDFSSHFGGNKGHLFGHGLHMDDKSFEAVKKSELLGWSPSLGGAGEGPSVLGLMCERMDGGVG